MTNSNLAAEQAAGLRALADMIEANPEIAPYFDYTLTSAGINAHLPSESDKAAIMAQLSRIARRHKGTVTKNIDEKWHNLVIDFGGVTAKVLAYREEVCERVVTGVETVTKQVPDPNAPLVEVTEQVEQVEWVCRPLLAAEATS